jgi:beta-lactamase regulating signal transducer with metallopeptidase domain
MNFPSVPYLLNVALHAVILSVLASLVLACLGQPGHRSAVALVGLLAIAFMPWFTALRPAPAEAQAVGEVQTLPLPTWTVVSLPAAPAAFTAEMPAATPPAGPALIDLPSLMISAWVAGAGLGLVMFVVALLRVRCWRKTLIPLDDASWRKIDDPEGLTRDCFQLSESSASPCVIGFWRPRIVLPRHLFAAESREGLHWAIRHETAHLQAGDSRWVIVFALIRSANWWNPFVHRLVSQWAEAREQLCDLHATGASKSRADYSEFLIAMARGTTVRPPLAVAMAKRPHAIRLKRRIRALLAAPQGHGKSLGKPFIGIIAAVFLGAAALVSTVRIGAQEPVAETLRQAEPKAEVEDKEDVSTTQVPAPPVARAVRQVKTSSKLLLTHEKPAIAHGAVLSQGEMDLYMRKLAETKGTLLATAPSVTQKDGHLATIEIIREVPGTPEPVAGRNPELPSSFTGIVFRSKSELIGKQANVEFDAEYRFVPGLYHPIQDLSNKPDSLDPDQIKIVKRVGTGRLDAGQTLCIDLGEIEPDRYLQVFSTVVPINEAGMPLDSFEDGKLLEDNHSTRSALVPEPNPYPGQPDFLPSPEVPGYLLVNGIQIDLPRDSKLPDGVRYIKQLLPTKREDLDALIKHYDLKKRELKQVRISLNQARTPWPEFPAIRLSASASKNHKVIHLTCDSATNGKSEIRYLQSGGMVLIDVPSGDPSIERRIYMTVDALADH